MAAKVHNFDTRDYILKTKDQTEKTELEKKIPDVSYFVKKPNSLNQKTKFQMLVLQQKRLY